jgi:hypothetical protein
VPAPLDHAGIGAIFAASSLMMWKALVTECLSPGTTHDDTGRSRRWQAIRRRILDGSVNRLSQIGEEIGEAYFRPSRAPRPAAAAAPG